jgi:hypothetical protein
MRLSPSDVSMALGLLLSGLNLIVITFTLRDRFNAPEEEQNKRLDKLEDDMKDIKARHDEDKVRITQLEDAQRVSLKGLSALLAHGINGNNVDQMRTALDELNSFLISK